jgi:phosphatidylglycerol:prolipoprotein diacylglycerol transferase
MRPELFTIPGINFTVPGYGAMVLLAFLSATWWMTRRARRVKIDPDIVLNLAFISLVTSTVGARAFYVIHYWRDQFADDPASMFSLSKGGFEVYGGLIGAFVCCLLYGLIKRLPIRIYADAAAPSILLGMGIGRIGCFLFGCCWGSACPDALPWGVQFPFGSPPYNRQWEQRQITSPAQLTLVDPSGVAGPMPRALLNIPVSKLEGSLKKLETSVAEAEAKGDQKKIDRARQRLDTARQSMGPLFAHYDAFGTSPEKLKVEAASPELRTLRLHPSQLYGAVGPLLLAFLTNAYFYRRQRHGTVMPLAFMLYAVERFVEEAIRSDNPLDTFGLTVSQGVSVAVFVTGLLVWLILKTMPLRSEAKPWTPEGKKNETNPEAAAVAV